MPSSKTYNIKLVCISFLEYLKTNEASPIYSHISNCNVAVGSTYNYAAPLYNKVIKFFQEGNIEAARKQQLLSVKMVQLLVNYGGIGAGKAFMKLIDVDCGWFRAPIERPTDIEVQNLKLELEEIGFFDFCSKMI